MSDATERRGQCLCGAVKITAKSASSSAGACHCSMCRRWSGGPLLAVDCGTDIAIEGEDQVKVFDSSAWAERGFCGSCGTHLFYRLKENGQFIVPAGLFENEEGLVFDHQVFIDEKPAFYDFSNETENMTGAEIAAKYGVSI
ncbi:GFA family protein [Algihabitans albus]|uniref:GFA family protein n=1 Tax=Algihabitans albus TaxID=2164067 RepID=UPI000E5D4E95|nr:GFA family protein [Algihabitans albus]